MLDRREFLKSTVVFTGGLAFSKISNAAGMLEDIKIFNSKRPAPAERKFTSEIIEKTIVQIKSKMKDEELAWIFENCFPNTLDTTITKHGLLNNKQDTFVITGDIPAMWLRDSAAQVYPYLPFIKEDSNLKKLIQGVINRQVKCVLIDPYANAFNYDDSKKSHWYSDKTDMKPELHERKWEVDSLCYVIRLSYKYWEVTGDVSLFDEDWVKAMELIIKTFREQQRKEGDGPYKFQRVTESPTDSLCGRGYGFPVKPVGLICSMFRPSDDATIYPFLIPSNIFAVTALSYLSEILDCINMKHLAVESRNLAAEINEAVQKYAVAEHAGFGSIYAYEVDGFGNRIFMDDANIPSLLSLPYISSVNVSDPVYSNTRKFLLSSSNPYFVIGKYGEGIGSEHTKRGTVWHLSVIARALTSTDDSEIINCLELIKKSHADTGFMHESFNINNPSEFSRKWFAWANTMFGELIIKLFNERPFLLAKL